MPLDNLAEDLLEAAFESLAHQFKQDHSHCDFIKLIIDEVNGDTFTFLLYNGASKYHWERKIWYKQNDIAKISNPVDSLKYIGQKIIPNIIKQQGVTNAEEAKEIFQLTRSLLELDSHEKSNEIVIDGTDYLLQIKLANTVKEFKWKTIPYGWAVVEQVSNKLITLNNKMY